MSISSLRWQRTLAIMVAVVMVLALVTPNAADAHKAPVAKQAGSMPGKFYNATRSGASQGPVRDIAERLYGPTRSIDTNSPSYKPINNGPYNVAKGTFRLPWAKGKGPQPGGGGDEGGGDLHDTASPTLWSFWEGQNQGGNRTLFGFGFLPPDTNGDTSGDVYSYGYYVQTINTTVAVWDYSQSNVYGGWPKTIMGPIPMNTLFTGFGGPCEFTNDGDPIVRYDEQADRWLISQFALPNFPYGDFSQCIAISQTGDPSGAYYLYQFDAPITGIDDDQNPNTGQVGGVKMPDYPKFGIWQDQYTMTVNQFNEGSLDWGGAGIYTFDRSTMLSGGAAGYYYYDPFSWYNCSLSTLPTSESNPYCFMGGMLPADNDGYTWANWGGGNDAYFAQFDDNSFSTPGYIVPDQLEIWGIAGFGGSLYNVTNLPVNAFDSNMCGYGRDCIPQPGTSVKLDAISDRLMDRLQFRHITVGTIDYEAMVTNHTVDVNGADHAGVRWYELRRQWDGVSWDPWYVYQQGTYAPDGDNRWMGSIAMDAVGNLALGYTVSSSSTAPTIRYTTHGVTDPLGTMRDENYITSSVSAAGSQTSTSHRWGDYSNMSVASDGCDFVYTSEYLRGTTPAEFYTRMGNFGFINCFYGDIEGPVTYWLSTPNLRDYSRDGMFDWDSTDATGTDHYECKLDGGSWFECSPAYYYYGLSTGTHTFQVYGVDVLDNVGPTISYTWDITAATATMTSNPNLDGYLIESSEFSNLGGAANSTGYYIYFGDQIGDKQVKGLLSFNVSLPPTAVVTAARVKYRLSSYVGTNPFTTLGPLMLDIATPYFGTGSGLTIGDFQAAASTTNVASCDNFTVSNWYTCYVDGGSLWTLNLFGTNQFRMYFATDDNDNGRADEVGFYSGNYTNISYRPVLIIDYYIP